MTDKSERETEDDRWNQLSKKKKIKRTVMIQGFNND